MFKLASRITLVLLCNIFLFYFFTITRSASVDVVSFFIFCLNMMIAFMTKENRSFVPAVRGVNEKLTVRDILPLYEDGKSVNNQEDVENTLTNFQDTRNYIGLAFFVSGVFALAINLINVFML